MVAHRSTSCRWGRIANRCLELKDPPLVAKNAANSGRTQEAVGHSPMDGAGFGRCRVQQRLKSSTATFHPDMCLSKRRPICLQDLHDILVPSEDGMRW